MFARTALRLGRRIAAPAVPIRTARPLASPSHRAYASSSPDTPPPAKAYEVFDEDGKTRQKDRAISRSREQQEAGESEDPQVLDYIREEVADRITERIEDSKTPPAIVVESSSHAGQSTRMLQEVLGDKSHPSTEPGGVMGQEKRKWIMVEPSSEASNRDDDSTFLYPPERIQCSTSDFSNNPESQKYADKVDAIVSAGGSHWVGDIVGAFTQAKHLLKPDGVFIAAVLGGDTSFELRTSLQLAEQERRGGIANRVSPMISATDAPSLSNRAGFTLTTVDTDEITINYPSMWESMADSRDMGESNAILGRRTHISRDVLLAASSIYQELYGNEDGTVPATFQMIFFIGWKPAPNQPKPLERGSAKTSSKDVL